MLGGTMVELKLVPHSLFPDMRICEVWVDGVFRAAIYPREPNGIRLVSTHLDGDPTQEPGIPIVWNFDFKTGL
jgi:hypothetical protein